MADLPPPPPVETALVEYVQERCEATGVEVLHLGVRAEGLDGAEVHWSGDPCSAQPDLQLIVSRPDRLTELTVRPRLAIAVPVWVVAESVEAGQPISARRGEALLHTLRGTPVDRGEWVARKPLRPGTALTDATVTLPVQAQTGDAVEIVMTSGALTIKAQGRLLQNARIGDPVQVANQATGLAQRGVLVSPQRVEIRR